MKFFKLKIVFVFHQSESHNAVQSWLFIYLFITGIFDITPHQQKPLDSEIVNGTVSFASLLYLAFYH